MSEHSQQQLLPRKFVPVSVDSHQDPTDNLFSHDNNFSKRLKPERFGSLRHSLLRTWGFVILCCTGAVGIIIVITFVLLPIQNKPLPSLPYHLSINAVISILVTTMKACSLMALAEGLGQLKWNYFRKERPLKHLVTYDLATRGPLGCLQLLLTIRCRDLTAILGALATILTIPIDAFTQQLIRYYSCPIVATNGSVASISRASIYTEYVPNLGATLFPATVEQIGRIVGAVYAPDSVKIPFTCTTGNCEFNGSYATISYCAECQDATEELSSSWVSQTRLVEVFLAPAMAASANETTEYYANATMIHLNGARADPMSTWVNVTTESFNTTLPSGLWSATSSEDAVYFSMGSFADPKDIETTVVEMILGARSDYPLRKYAEIFGSGCDHDWQKQTWGCTGRGAARCKIRPCVKTHNARVDAGKLDESLSGIYSSWYVGRDIDSYFPQLTMADLNCVNNDAKETLRNRGFNVSSSRFIPYDVGVSFDYDNFTQLMPPDARQSNTTLSSSELEIVPKTCIYEIQRFTTRAVQDFLTTLFNITVSPSIDGSALIGSPQGQLILNNTYINLATVNKTFEAVAQALSIRMRQWGHNNTDTYRNPIIGTAYITTTCINVQWPWLIYPAILASLTIIFCTAMFARTQAFGGTQFAQGWKNSPLPLVYHGITSVHGDGSDDREDLNDIHVMERSAENSMGIVAHRSKESN